MTSVDLVVKYNLDRMRSLVISSSKERRTSVPSGEMVEEEMEKRWGSLARGRKASLPVLTSYKRLSTIDTLEVSTDKVDVSIDKVDMSVDKVDSSRIEGGSSRESSSSRTRTRDTGALITRERRSTPAR